MFHLNYGAIHTKSKSISLKKCLLSLSEAITLLPCVQAERLLRHFHVLGRGISDETVLLTFIQEAVFQIPIQLFDHIPELLLSSFS